MSDPRDDDRLPREEYHQFLQGVSLNSIEVIQLQANAAVRWVDIDHSGATYECQFDVADWHHEPDTKEFIAIVRAAVAVSHQRAEGEARDDLGMIACTYGAVYTSQTPVTEAHLKIFGRNVHLHVWPYFRQLVADTTGRFGWLPLTLPMGITPRTD